MQVVPMKMGNQYCVDLIEKTRIQLDGFALQVHDAPAQNWIRQQADAAGFDQSRCVSYVSDFQDAVFER